MIGGPINPSEKKALLIALIPCLLFIAFLTVMRGAVGRTQRISISTPPLPPPPAERFHVEEPVVADLHGDYPLIPLIYKGIDFRTRSYGPYKLADGKTVNLALQDGEHRVLDKNYSAWFSLKDVYYTDITGDGKEEAIAMISHVSCDPVGSCDGGTHLFYVYSVRNGKLRQLWQYETGSNAYGCGLQSLTVNGKQFVFELFGRCPKNGTNEANTQKFIAQDVTFVQFEFDGQRFVRKNIEIVPTASRSIRNYQPHVEVYEPPTPLDRDTRGRTVAVF